MISEKLLFIPVGDFDSDFPPAASAVRNVWRWLQRTFRNFRLFPYLDGLVLSEKHLKRYRFRALVADPMLQTPNDYNAKV